MLFHSYYMICCCVLIHLLVASISMEKILLRIVGQLPEKTMRFHLFTYRLRSHTDGQSPRSTYAIAIISRCSIVSPCLSGRECLNRMVHQLFLDVYGDEVDMRRFSPHWPPRAHMSEVFKLNAQDTTTSEQRKNTGKKRNC